MAEGRTHTAERQRGIRKMALLLGMFQTALSVCVSALHAYTKGRSREIIINTGMKEACTSKHTVKVFWETI